VYQALGVDPDTEIRDLLDQPLGLNASGRHLERASRCFSRCTAKSNNHRDESEARCCSQFPKKSNELVRVHRFKQLIVEAVCFI
jgi:hypothetical protein